MLCMCIKPISSPLRYQGHVDNQIIREFLACGGGGGVLSVHQQSKEMLGNWGHPASLTPPKNFF